MSHSSRLHLEQLEDRRLLSGNAGPDVTYHGGPLLQNVQVQNVYYGQGWTTDASLQQTITQTDSFLNYLVASPYMSALQQYNAGNGTLLTPDDVVNQNPTNQTIDDSQIRQVLNTEITAQHVAAPGANSLYVFYTAPGVEVTAAGQNSNDNFSGYHDVFTDAAGASVYYAVIPYPVASTNGGLSAFQQETIALSHEVAESVTDPDTQTGWFDARYGEIADIANGQYGLLNSYDVSAVWSQSAGQVVLPGAASSSSTSLQVSGVQVDATAGQPFTSIVATLTNAPSGATNASYTASIDWGNGTTSAGTVTNDPNGGFDVTGTNTYAQAGAFPISVSIDDASGTVAGTALTTAHVAAASPTVTATGTLLTATAGQGFSGTVATFTDSSAGAAAGNYAVTINWGDGTTSNGSVTAGSGGTFIVNGSHTYTTAHSGFFDEQTTVDGKQDYIVTVTINDSATNTTATALSLATVTPPAPVITATGENIAATSGQSFTGVVAAFTDTNASAVVGDFTATITWGDGSTSSGTVQSNPSGGFTVAGTHTYDNANYWFGFDFGNTRTFPISVSITDTKTQDQAAATSTATVARTAQNLSVAAQNISATTGVSFTGVVATFTDVSAILTAGNFTATINWGDGTTSTGTIVADPNGGFDVTGTHTYTTTSTPTSFWGWGHGFGGLDLPFGPGSGALPLSVTVNSTANSDTGASEASATISSPAINAQLSGTLIDAVFGKSFSGTVATFTTPASVTGWTATINWGDGTTSAGTITSTSGGYVITGTHTYGTGGTGLYDRFPGNDAEGPQPFLVSVTLNDPANNSTATAVSLASVASVPPPITASGVNLNLNLGTAFTGTVAAFTDSDSAGTSSFQATIYWGDGSSSSGTVTANPSGGFLVGGTHTYNRGGTYLVFVTVRDAGGNSAVSLSSAFVSDNTALSSLYSAGLGFVESVEYFTDLVVNDYREILGRTGRSSEIAYWVNLLQHGATDAQVAAGFLSSGEFMAQAGNNNTSWVDALYAEVLGRGADATGQNYWLKQLAAGASLNQVALGIETSQEHESMVVQGDYQQFLGRAGNSGEVGYWVSEFANGMSNEQIAASFLSSPGYFQQQHNNASDWIAGTYQTVLSRKPDPSGTNYWLSQLGG